MLAPEERYRVKSLGQSQHVGRRGLALAFGHDPVLDADTLAGMRIRPSGDVTGGIDFADAGLHEGIHLDPTIDGEPGLLGQAQTRPYTDADDHQVSVDNAAALEPGTPAVDRVHADLNVNHEAMRFMERADTIAHLRPKHTFHRPLFRRHHMNLEVARTQ